MPAEAPHGQDLPASLIADEVTYDRETRLLTASGNVEVLYQGRVLRARRIVYDEAADEIRAEGPLVLTDPAGGVLLADAAALTPDLADGLISSARLLIAGQLQLAAVEVRRTRPLRDALPHGRELLHDLRREPDAHLGAARLARHRGHRGAPHLLRERPLRALRRPDRLRAAAEHPRARASSGRAAFWCRASSQSDIFGLGFKLPYYRMLGPSADMTVTPFVTTEGGVLLEGEYRTRFANGGFDIGASSPLDERTRGRRGHCAAPSAAIGSIRPALRRSIADFDFAVASDDSFLAQYDYSDADRLTSIASINRTLTDEYVSARHRRLPEPARRRGNRHVPFVFPEFTYRRLFGSTVIGGRFGVYGELARGAARRSAATWSAAGGGVDWNREWLLPRGLLASTTGAALVDLYRVWDDPDEPDGSTSSAVPTAAAELRWPLVRSTPAAPTT